MKFFSFKWAGGGHDFLVVRTGLGGKGGGKESSRLELVHCHLEITHCFFDCFIVFYTLQNALTILSSFNPHSIIKTKLINFISELRFGNSPRLHRWAQGSNPGLLALGSLRPINTLHTDRLKPLGRKNE